MGGACGTCGNTKDAYRVFIENRETTWKTQGGSIRTDFQETGLGSVDWIDLAQVATSGRLFEEGN